MIACDKCGKRLTKDKLRVLKMPSSAGWPFVFEFCVECEMKATNEMACACAAWIKKGKKDE